ncbi:MAG: amine oxidase [Acidobacteria bacterium RIFCSPLOWO2_02_FULL_67_36]|nr:MAG: amine oxidase [Acidobacteria bacterium RIFCSPLOWO2_02_FULL_67_36]OFW24352.1 MAG: amine oxidase [Acidobacteria bacterium RIFCSPLOWO2_12_FULL_66_21]
MHYDAIVIGGGHNGLVNAAYLARAGRKVLVLERRHVLGGAAVTEEIHPGFKYSVCSYVVSLLRPDIIRELDLPRHGLEILPLDGTFTPMPDGNHLWRVNDHARTRREIMRHSRVDAEAYDEYGRAMVEMGRFVKPMLDMTPPDPTSLDPRGLMDLLFLGRRFQALSEDDKYNQIQLMTMSAVDFLDQWFETDVLKATMSASGIIGTFLGVRSPGTAYVLLHHYMGEIDGAFRSWGLSRGGTGAISNAIASAAREAGAEIRTRTPVSKIIVKEGTAVGVVLEGGDYLTATVIASSVDPHLTFLKMVGAEHLPDEFADEVRRYKFRGSSGKVNLSLDALPDFTAMPGPGAHLRGAISISPSVEYMERAYDEAKYGRYSRRPYIDVVIPSLTDPSVAPPGKHVMSCFVQYAPYHLEGTNWDDERERFGDTVVNTIAEYAPNIEDIILHRQVVTPLDLEREWGLTEGNIFQGELTLEQLFFLRPAPGWAQYRTPVRNLYMCGSATHPGGGIMGAPGRNAARRILKEVGGRRSLLLPPTS